MGIDQREALLDAGVRMIHAHGFGATGVREIATAAGVPQGSFTNHFRSKEAFGIEVLDRYTVRLDAIMRETLDDETLSPAQRLESYFERISINAEGAEWRRGCIVPDLASEIGAYGEALREHLCAVMLRQSERFAAVVRLLRPGHEDEAADLAAVLLAAWHGTLLRMKVERSPAALDRFRRVLASLIRPAGGG